MLKRDEEVANWQWTARLYQDLQQPALPLGAFEPSRVRQDFAVERELQDLNSNFNPMSAIDDHFLDQAVHDANVINR